VTLVSRPASLIPVVHAVTTSELVTRPDFLVRAHGVMGALGPRGALHLRAPRLSALELYRIAETLSPAQPATGCWLVVVDRTDVAAAAAARGVQLTSESLTVADACRIAPALAVGASAHSLAEARTAAKHGAVWVVVEFPRHGPAGTDRASALARIGDLAREVAVPLVVIGGVRPDHVPQLREAGAHGVAVIRGIWEAENAERAATDYLSAHDAPGST
jgi:thiamine-phosphate diphosphorylase